MGSDTRGTDHGREPVEVVRSEERLTARTVRTPSGRVRIGKRIITRVETIEVSIRREELYVEQERPEESGFRPWNAPGPQQHRGTYRSQQPPWR